MPLIPDSDPLLIALRQVNSSYAEPTSAIIISAWAEGSIYHGITESDETLKQGIEDHAAVFVERCLTEAHIAQAPYVLLSSGHVYDESEMICGDCGPQGRYRRDAHPVGRFRWEALCALCGEMMSPTPHTEADLLTQTHPHGLWFIAVETQLAQMLSTRSLSLTILRLFQPYWPVKHLPHIIENEDEKLPLIMQLATELLNDNPILIEEDGNQTRCVTWIGDVDQAIALSLNAPPKLAIYNVATLSTLPLFMMVALLQESTQKTTMGYTFSQAYPNANPRHRFADTRRIESELGFARSAQSLQDLCDQLVGTL